MLTYSSRTHGSDSTSANNSPSVTVEQSFSRYGTSSSISASSPGSPASPSFQYPAQQRHMSPPFYNYFHGYQPFLPSTPVASWQMPSEYDYPLPCNFPPFPPPQHTYFNNSPFPTATASPSHQVHHNSNSFIAVLRSGNISRCTSCAGLFQKNEQLVVLKHIEKTEYIKDGETRVSGERPHYYHASTDCICHRHSYFLRDLLEVDDDLYDTLIPSNKQLLDNIN